MINDHSLWPSLIIVNKRGMFEKIITKISKNKVKEKYIYTSLESKEKWGECFSKILFHLKNLVIPTMYRLKERHHANRS